MSWTSEVKGDLLSRVEVLAKEDVMCVFVVNKRGVGGW